uniref:Uncharacterized protein n=1 Tax=Eutreptiella gymnastica TaxID=73025 RepID=A0A7S4CW03_9EUGL
MRHHRFGAGAMPPSDVRRMSHGNKPQIGDRHRGFSYSSFLWHCYRTQLSAGGQLKEHLFALVPFHTQVTTAPHAFCLSLPPASNSSHRPHTSCGALVVYPPAPRPAMVRCLQA